MATNNKILNCPPLRFPEFSDEWTQTALREVASFCGGGTPSSEKISYWNGHIPWISSSDISAKSISNINTTRFISEEALSSSATKLCKAPCIVIVSRVGVGKLAYSESDICTSQDFCNMYDIKENYIFMSYRLLPIINKKSLEVQGTSIKGITMQEIKSLLVSLPSLAEQKKIADFLSLIDERIQCLSEIIKERKREKAALLNQLFSQKLRFPEFSDEWQETTLGEIGRTYNGLSGKSAEDFGDGFPYITYKMVYDDIKIDLTNVEYVRVSESESQSQVELGDILFTTSSETPEETGLCSVLLSSCDKLYLNSFCFGYRLNEENLAKSVSLGYALRSPIYRSKLSTLAQGSTRYNISKSEVMRMPISLPSLAEQKKIAEFLSLIDERRETEEELLKQYEAQKKYLLRQMFV